MSAGHHVSHSHSRELQRELRECLADKRVRKLFDSASKVDFSHPMPLTGGSTVQWGTFFLDPRLKQRFTVGKKANADLSKPVLAHEMVEKALRQVFRMSYDRAHTLATTAERLLVEESGLDWTAYKRVMAKIVRRDEHEHPKSMPKGFDYGPVRESRGVKSIRWLKRGAA